MSQSSGASSPAQSNPSSPKSWRIPGPSPRWQNFLVCVLLLMVFPTAPLWLELWRTRAISESTIAMVAALYSITIGISTRNKLLTGWAFFSSFFYMGAFGMTVNSGQPLYESKIIGLAGIGVLFILHLLERINRHLLAREPFLYFFA